MSRAFLVGLLAWSTALVAEPSAGQTPGGVEPLGPTSCPPDHPVKVYASKRSDGPGVYYTPGSGFYGKVKPERCFATERAARQAGYREGREERPPAADDGRTRRRNP
ncbi:MAG TPA: hypothetical protein VIG07_17785 [Methylomirabilota bacterium]|jgi:hypothetical protein